VPSPSTRRSFSRAAFCGLAALSVRRNLFADTPATPLKADKLSDTISLISGAGCNVLVVIGPDGVLMVDGGTKDRSAELLKLVGKPVKFLFNTHWHPEVTGSNEALGKSGAKIIASEYTKEWMSTQVDWGWQKKTFEPAPAVALPNQTFYTASKMTFGKEQVNYALMPFAHTDGDIYVHLPGANILMAGDVVSAGAYPVLDYTTGGWITGMINAQKTLLGLAKDDTKIVPGIGPVQSKAEVQALNDMLTTVRDRIVKSVKQGKTPKEIAAEKPTQEFDAKWGDPELFVLNCYRGLWAHVRELGGIV
jgi:cyclase